MTKNEIVDRIRQIRYNAGLSARELSLRIGKNEAYISRLESANGTFEPSISVLLDIIEVCGSTESEFFYYKIDAYKKDKIILDLLSKIKDDSTKDAIITILENVR